MTSAYKVIQSKYLDGGPITAINVSSGGSGYITAPTVRIEGGGGAGATGTAVLGSVTDSVNTITVTDGGSGYTSAPTVVVDGDGSGATATANLAVTGPISTITVDSGGSGYTVAPTVTVANAGAGTGAVLVAVLGSNTGVDDDQVVSVTVSNGGSGYPVGATLTFTPDGFGSGAAGTISRSFAVNTVTVTDGGTGYNLASTTVSFFGGGGTGAAGTISLIDETLGDNVVSVIVTNNGSGYTSAPSIYFDTEDTVVDAVAVADIDSLVANVNEFIAGANTPVIDSQVSISTVHGRTLYAQKVTYALDE